MNKLLAILLLLFFSMSAQAEVQSRVIVYQVNGVEFTGYLAFDDAISGKRPGILVMHEWWGHNAYARKRADMLATMGYTAFALDMYGTGKLAKHPDDAKAFMQAAMSDMTEMKKRFQAALDILLKQASVNQGKTAVIGYCMGGGMALAMARAGVDVDGVAVFHGSLATQLPAQKGQIKAEVMVFTGAEDPFAPIEQVQAFEKEMDDAGVIYTLKTYPKTKHSFTNPEADAFAEKFGMPLAYNKLADEDSWQQMQQFFTRIFK
ncbi:MAG: dienelactone hydrolase family protein [Mariprofundaceae bacterium]